MAGRVITLTTDFGHQGPFVAVMRGVILARAPEARVIDLTHEIHVHWPAEAGFWLWRAYGYFPAGTVHVAVVDPGVGTSRDIIAVEHDGHVFLAPDNGLLPGRILQHPTTAIHRLDERWRRTRGWPEPSSTFHGRDIFAPLAADLVAGRCRPADIGPRTTDPVPSRLEEPEATPAGLRGAIVTVDHFGNLISNIEREMLTGLAQPVVQAGGRRIPLRETYGRAQPGEFLALVNSFGVLEIARAEGNAANGLGLGLGAPVTVSDAGG